MFTVKEYKGGVLGATETFYTVRHLVKHLYDVASTEYMTKVLVWALDKDNQTVLSFDVGSLYEDRWHKV